MSAAKCSGCSRILFACRTCGNDQYCDYCGRCEQGCPRSKFNEKRARSQDCGPPPLSNAQMRMLRKTLSGASEDGIWAPCGIRGFGQTARALERRGLVYLWGAAHLGAFVRGVGLTDAGRAVAEKMQRDAMAKARGES